MGFFSGLKFKKRTVNKDTDKKTGMKADTAAEKKYKPRREANGRFKKKYIPNRDSKGHFASPEKYSGDKDGKYKKK